MKNIAYLTQALILAAFFAIPATAQTGALEAPPRRDSLAQISPNEKFTSEKCGFSVALPTAGVMVKTNDTARTLETSYTWRFTEGIVVVLCRESLRGPSGKAFVLAQKKDLFKDKNMKLVAETPYSVGKYRGSKYSVAYYEITGEARIMALGRRSFGMTVVSDPSSNGLAALVKILDSFTPTGAPAR